MVRCQDGVHALDRGQQHGGLRHRARWVTHGGVTSSYVCGVAPVGSMPRWCARARSRSAAWRATSSGSVGDASHGQGGHWSVSARQGRAPAAPLAAANGSAPTPRHPSPGRFGSPNPGARVATPPPKPRPLSRDCHLDKELLDCSSAAQGPDSAHTHTHHTHTHTQPAPSGDRHLGNMLLDRRTAAVLQIDLGVAFEQGSFLNTPETVRWPWVRGLGFGWLAQGLGCGRRAGAGGGSGGEGGVAPPTLPLGRRNGCVGPQTPFNSPSPLNPRSQASAALNMRVPHPPRVTPAPPRRCPSA